MNILKMIFGTKNARDLKRLRPIVAEINRIEAEYEAKHFTDEDFPKMTESFRKRVAEGESLDHILPEAYALVKNACRHLVGTEAEVCGHRLVWDMIPFDCQLVGGIVLHQGKIAEMQTGEGKTLVATLPLYLNALAGKNVQLVTVNDYLARRDASWMGHLYRYLGLTVGCIQNSMESEERRKQYRCDITYGTNSEFGFDYLRDNGMVSGAGNVAIYAIEKAQQMGAKVVTCSDSSGWIYDPNGIDVAALKEIKEVKRQRLTEYLKYRPQAQYREGRGVWQIPCDIALPCATQNELTIDDAKQLVANGVYAVAEGANMPSTADAVDYFLEQGILFLPAKAANAGGVATSALEMSQNSERLHWTFEEVDHKLREIMVDIYHNIDEAARQYGKEGNFVDGANIAGFLKVMNAMNAQGIV